jgi:hypothetical protein
MHDWSLLMDGLTLHPIDKAPWSGFSYGPRTSFSITHVKNAILLKFHVNERNPRITFHSANDPVYKDSCVEFFVSFDGLSYYNLEFNAIGTCLMAHGKDRKQRTSLSPALIQSFPQNNDLNWSLTLKIPLEIFIHDNIPALSDAKAKANFYKCGDECATPHYLAWNNIPTPAPDFHQPAFFGDLLFL